MRASDRLVDTDRAVGQWGVDNATSLVDGRARARDRARRYARSSIAAMIVARASSSTGASRTAGCPCSSRPSCLGEILVVNTVKELLDRVRPEFNPIAETLGPSFPSGHSGLAAAFYAGAALVLARKRSPQDARASGRRRGRDRRGRRVQPCSPRRPLDVGRARRARARMGVVRHLRDRVRRPLPRARCAGRARRGGRRAARATSPSARGRLRVRRRRGGSGAGRSGGAVCVRRREA